jgi:hypothetical protein
MPSFYFLECRVHYVEEPKSRSECDIWRRILYSNPSNIHISAIPLRSSAISTFFEENTVPIDPDMDTKLNSLGT